VESVLSVLKEYGISSTKKQIINFMKEMGIQGSIAFGEFIAIVDKITGDTSAQEQDELLEAFRMFGGHVSGHVSAQQFQDGMLTLGVDLDPDEVESLFMEADKDKDGFLNFEEWHKILRRDDSKEEPESPTSPTSKARTSDLAADPMAL